MEPNLNNPYDDNNNVPNSNNNNEFSNPFENDFNQNKDLKEQNNKNPNTNKDDLFSNPFKDEFKDSNNNNKDNNKNQNNNDKNNNLNEFANPFANPFANEFNDNNDNNKSDNNKFFFNPYSDRDNNYNNPFEENINNNPFVNNFGQQNFNVEQPNNNFFYQKNQNKSNINNNNNYNENNNNFKVNNNNDNINNNSNNNNNFNNDNNYNFQNNNNNIYNSNNNNFNNKNFNPDNNNFNNQNNNYRSNINNNNINNIASNDNLGNNEKDPNLQKTIPQESSNDNDTKRIKAIISKCESVVNTAKTQYDAFDIRDAITTICKAIKGLDTLKNTINTQKQNCSYLLPLVTALRNKSFATLQEYRIMIYRIIPIRFKPVLYKPYEDHNDSLINFCGKYILNKPFISFDDIYENKSIDEMKKIKNTLNNNLSQAQKTGNKCFLIYGPKGCGKTLYVHALANQMGAKIAQIEGIELFKIPFFSREFIKACFANMQFKPLIIYMKNIEQMFSVMNNFNYIYDKIASSYELNVYFFASSSINVYNLPRQIADKFQFFQCIKPVLKEDKSDYIRFIGRKIGIEIKMNDKELNNLAMDNLNHFSNRDIFDLICNAIEIKKQNSPPNDLNMVYREGLYEDDIMKAFSNVQGSLTTEILKSYYI